MREKEQAEIDSATFYRIRKKNLIKDWTEKRKSLERGGSGTGGRKKSRGRPIEIPEK